MAARAAGLCLTQRDVGVGGWRSDCDDAQSPKEHRVGPMNLSDLIEETLSEIAKGVKNAKERSRSVLAISPGTLDGRMVAEITYIEFDVSLIVSEASEDSVAKEKGIGGNLKVVSVGGLEGRKGHSEQGKTSTSSQFTHRVAFKVPVCMAAEFNAK